MKSRKFTSFASLTAVACLFCSNANAGSFKSITIDGDFSDWAGVPLLHTSPTNSNTSVVDYKDIYVANDDDYLYIRFTLHKSDNPFTFLQNIFVDADNNGLSGFGAGGYVGSEMLIQEGTGYQEKNGGFNEGGINGLDWLAAPIGAGTEFECRISRATTYATDSQPVFASPSIAFVLEAEISFTPTEWAPALVGGITYDFETAPVALTTNLPLITLATTWQANDAGADLGATWLDQSYDDTGAGWTTGSALFGYTPSPGSYPAINTALTSGPTTYYFRTHFNWNNLNNNVAFVSTNYFSDGAVLYLNGSEVRRVRMPAGAVGYGTSATGAAAPVGQVEVFGISGGGLVIGDNILEVETHQAAGTAADMVFGLSLTAAAQYPVLNVNSNLPTNKSIVAGQPLAMTSDVIGSGPLHYQWLKNGSPIVGATNASYTVPIVLTNDAGNYVLVATNSFNSITSRSAVVTVTSTPITFNDPAQPVDAYVLEGQPVTLGVTVSGSPLIQYQWFKGASSILDATNASYTIANPVLTDAGSYKVAVTNPSGVTNSRTASLTVLADKVAPTVTAAVASARA